MNHKIIQYGHPALSLRAKEIEKITDSVISLFGTMDQVMFHANGCGLAAPQIAISSRLMTVLCDSKTLHIANPVIKESSGMATLSEGCLSIPSVSLPIKRPKSVLVEYLTRDGEVALKEFSGLTARIIQHELDHLDGKLIVDYIDAEHRHWILQSLGYCGS